MSFTKSFRVSKEDYLRFSRFAYQRLSKPKNQWLSTLKNFVVWLVITIVFMYVIESFKSDTTNIDWLSAAIGASPFALLLCAFIFYLIKYQRLVFPRDNGLLLGENTLEINEKGIEVANINATAQYSWKCVEEVAENNGDFYFFLDTIYAIIIPKTALTDQQDLDNLRGCIEKYV